MNKLLLWTLLWLCCAQLARGQFSTMSGSADSNRFGYYNNRFLADAYRCFPGDSARAQKMHARWEGFWSERAAYDAPDSISIFAPINIAMGALIGTGIASNCLHNGYKGNWKPLGPMRDHWGQTTDQAGRITALWVSPTDTNYLLAGAAGGGLWKTTDGGKSWANITDGAEYDNMPGTLGVTDVAVSAANPNLIYIATGTAEAYVNIINGVSQRISVGLMYSSDAGAHWNIDYNYRSVSGAASLNGWSDDYIRKMAYTPSGRLLVMTSRHIYMKPASGGSWSDITPTNFSSLPPQYFLADFELTSQPASGGKVVFATSSEDDIQYLYYYNDAAGTWAARRTLNFGADINMVLGMGLSKSDSVCLVVESGGACQLYKTALSSGALLLRNSSLDAVSRDVACSQALEGIMYVTNHSGGTPFIRRSVNGGKTFSGVGGDTHPDGRTVQIYSSGTDPIGTDDVVFCGTDGGIAKKMKGSNSFISLSGRGLNIMQFTALSSSRTNNGQTVGGALDNSMQARMSAMPEPWQLLQSGDGMVPAFSSNGDTVVLTQHQTGMQAYTIRFRPALNTVGNGSGSAQPPDNASAYAAAGRRWKRPIRYDQANIARVGFHFIFKTDNHAATWTPAFSPTTDPMNEPKPAVTMATTPANLAMMRDFKKPVDFYISDQYPDVGYIAYDNLLNSSNHEDINYGNLFVCQNLTTDKDWIKINPPAWDLPITDIEVDPAAPNRIWVAMGSIYTWQIQDPDDEREKRVFYSDNYGAEGSWTDISKGLTALPVTKIVYVPGSDDVLFAGTDIGVYRWNKTLAKWECFNEGMPRCIISDMEVLPCSGKLRVATYGRGMWETSYGETYADINPGDVYTITANTTWSQSKTIEGSIRVKAGKTLTISGSGTTIYMPQRGEIHVEKGAKLVLDGARITNDCDSSRWRGIVLTGDKTLAPTAANQGTFEMKNGAVIENAAVGVRDYNDATLQGGGRILASNSTFLNCWKAVSLNDYPNYDRSASCTFTNVTFKIDHNRVMEASNGTLPPHLFTAFNERGVKLKGCIFTDERALDHGDKRATALGVTDADFTVDSCQFLNLQRGVYADVVYVNPMAPKPTIVNSTFDHTRENITVYAHNPLVRSNTFTNLKPDLPSGIGLKKAAWAVYLEGTRGASVFHNSISGNASSTLNTGLNNLRYGLIVKDGGTTWSTLWQGANVINNSFTNLMAGLQTERQNLGLTVSCNSFTRNTSAFRINPLTGGMAGPIIRPQHGSCNPSDSRPNNTFSNNGGGIRSWITTPAYYLQYYVNSAGPGPYIPTGNSGGVNVVSCSGLGATDQHPKCNRVPVISWSSALLSSALSAYNSARAANPDSDETWYWYGEVVRGYTQLDNLPGLKSFLLSDNTDASKIQLLPIYLDEGNYQTITSTINGMSASSTEKSAFNSYFSILIALKQSGRNLLQLTQNEQATMQSVANSETHIANAAKSLLEWGYGIAWNHIPEEPAQARPGQEEPVAEAAANRSRLGDAAPNPVSNTTQIPVWVLPYDAANGCYLVVRDITGKEMARYQLREGDNVVSVSTATWAPGLYAYSLLVDSQPVDTKKFSKVQ